MNVPTNVAHIAAHAGTVREAWQAAARDCHIPMEFWSSAETPKSVSLTLPLELMRMLPGLMSRCKRFSCFRYAIPHKIW